MVSIYKIGNNFNDTNVLEIIGLSTDTKPTNSNKLLSYRIPNGSMFLAMDTKEVSIFDEENELWYT